MKATEHIIAFIDILGYSNEVEKLILKENKSFIYKLKTVIREIENEFRNQLMKLKIINSIFKIKYYFFSDSIIVYTNLDNLNEIQYIEIASFFQLISKIQLLFWKKAIPIRGGISSGKGIISKNIFFHKH